MNRKGQALVEFILILPVFLIILMSIIDIGSIMIKKNELNDKAEIISEMYQNEKKEEMMAYISREDLEYKESVEGDLITFEIKKSVNVNAPILSKIIGKKYNIIISKTLYGENYE